MSKVKFWLVQILMISLVSFVLGGSVFAKGGANSKGAEMKNAHASDQAKSHANSNAGFDSEPAEEPPVEEPPVEEPPAEEEPTEPQCSIENSYLCADEGSCTSAGAEWLDGIGCI